MAYLITSRDIHYIELELQMDINLILGNGEAQYQCDKLIGMAQSMEDPAADLYKLCGLKELLIRGFHHGNASILSGFVE